MDKRMRCVGVVTRVWTWVRGVDMDEVRCELGVDVNEGGCGRGLEGVGVDNRLWMWMRGVNMTSASVEQLRSTA